MSRIKIEILFLLLLAIVLAILSSNIVVYKMEYHGFGWNWNPWYRWILFSMVIGFIIFNHIVMQINLLTNLLYSAISGMLFLIVSMFTSIIFVSFLEKLDNQKTPLGWQFKFKWLELFIFGILLVISTELIGRRLTRKASK